MLKGLASYLLCHMHWVRSSHNSHFSVSTMTIPHTFHREPLQPFSHSLFLQAKFNWLAWSGIWLHLPFRLVNGTEAVLQLCYLSMRIESNPAGGHNPQISSNMCFTSPCGWMCYYRALHALTAVCLLCDPACGSPNAGAEDSSEVYTQLLGTLFKQSWASARKGLHGKSKSPPTGDAVSSKGSQTEF